MKKNSMFFTSNNIKILQLIKYNFDKIVNKLSTYPLCFCHGDLKSPNLFYFENDVYFLDWQYAHLNKGVSDIAFLLVESLLFNADISDIAQKYYFRLQHQMNPSYTYKSHIETFKCSLSMFPFFVMVWFNSEDTEKLIDSSFPIKFMKNLLAYYDYYLDETFFENL